MQIKDRNKGFTLMEILIAMAIIGILTSVGYAAYTISFQKSRDAVRKNDLNQLSKALEAYYSDFGVYPPSQSGRLAACTNDPLNPAMCAWGGAFSLGNGGKVYMKQLPKDPVPSQTYIYVVDINHQKFQLFARLENANDPQNVAYPQPCGGNGESCTYGIASPNANVNETLNQGN